MPDATKDTQHSSKATTSSEKSFEKRRFFQFLTKALMNAVEENFDWPSVVADLPELNESENFSSTVGLLLLPSQNTALNKTRSIVHRRQLRNRFFESDLFEDPAWDMLLVLMIARLEQTDMSVSNLCKASGVPATTALRWIDKLKLAQLCDRVVDPTDGRRTFIVLTKNGARFMNLYLDALDFTSNLERSVVAAREARSF